MSFKKYSFAFTFKKTEPPPVNGSIKRFVVLGKYLLISG